MENIKKEICQEQLLWVRRRLEALDKIEVRLNKMRELAVYAASRTLNENEAAQIQEWVDILQTEVNATDRETAWAEKENVPLLQEGTAYQQLRH